MTERAINIENLRKEYGAVTAVNDISFSVREGEFFTLVGPSGSGKTTLLRMLSGLEEVTEGSVTIRGQDMTNVPAEKRPTNMVFQDLALFPFKSVYENLAFGLKMEGVGKETRRDRADEMLETLNLEGYGEKDIDELSGGEQQRIALGRSLLVEPDVLLLDEPLSSLDVKLRKEMQLELRRIHDDLDSTFFYVTHNQQVALTASDRIGIMNNGELIQIGTPREVYEQPATSFVAQFIGETNLWRGELTRMDPPTMKTEAGLEIVAADSMSLPEGSPVSVSIRPEQIYLSDALSTDNVFEATVSEQIYQGDKIIYEVTTDGSAFRVQQSAKEKKDLHDIGDTVYIGFDKDSVHVISEGTS